MSKLHIVVNHEYRTVLRQPSFWLTLLATPLLIAIVMGISILGERATTGKIEELQNKLTNIVIIDESGYVLPEIVESSNHTIADSSELNALKEKVRSGDLQAVVHFPEDLSKSNQYNVYVHGTDFTTIQTLTAYANDLLSLSIFAPVGSPEVIALAQGQANAIITTYENGQATPGFNKFVVPGIFAALFFVIIFFAVGYALTSISEEKENRSMEMLLTHVKPRTAITGKLLAVVLITFTQLIFFAIVGAIGYRIALLLGMESIKLPVGINLADLVFDPATIALSIGYLVVGFALYAGIMAIIASVMPAKQAASSSGLFYMAVFIPFWFLTTIMTDPENPAVTFVTYFPLTAPSTLLLRNTFGNIGGAEALTAFAVMTFFAALTIWFAIRIFPRGALEYSSMISPKALFRRK